MKITGTPLILLLLLSLAVSTLTAQARKRALLVGIGQYADAQFQPLHAARGLLLMRATLLNQGFADADIRILSDSAATQRSIRQAFEALRNQSRQGDIAVFHYYGHGTQIEDDGRDEADKLDEALVPFNGKRTSEKEHHNLIRDDDLGDWVHSLRQKIGPSGQVLVLLDACHSGSGLRSNKKSRQQTEQQQLNTGDNSDDATLAPLVAFYSSSPHEVSMEQPVENGEHLALLTWAFCQAMNDVRPANSFRGLFERIALLMATKGRRQTPQFEGTPDLQIFGQKITPPPPYFRSLLSLGPRELLVSGGQMLGLEPGARVALYPPETSDTARVQPLALGEVQTADLLECSVMLDRPVSEIQVQSAWIFTTQRRFSGYQLALHLNTGDPTLEARIRSRLAGMSAVELESGQPPELTLYKEKGKLLLRSADGAEVWKELKDRVPPEQAVELALGNYLQAQFLRKLNFEGSPYPVSFTAQIQNVTAGPPYVIGLEPRQEKDTVALKVTNHSTQPIFYTILDIDPQNEVQVLVPGLGRLPAEFRLEPGAESTSHLVLFNTPGREVLKLIASPVAIDLREAVASRGRSYRGRSFFENLFAQTYVEQGRGPTGGYSGNEAGVATVVLEVRK